MSNELDLEKMGSDLIVRFARPEARSPLSISVLDQLRDIVHSVAVDTSVNRVVFSGMDDVFASGADLREIAAVDGGGARQFALRGQTLMTKISELPQITVAAVNGFCFGGALDLALSCDHRIASPAAQFSHPGGSLGIMTGWGGTQRLLRLVGRGFALEMFFTGKRVGADEALKFGLIDLVAVEPVAEAIAFRVS